MGPGRCSVGRGHRESDSAGTAKLREGGEPDKAEGAVAASTLSSLAEVVPIFACAELRFVFGRFRRTQPWQIKLVILKLPVGMRHFLKISANKSRDSATLHTFSDDVAQQHPTSFLKLL